MQFLERCQPEYLYLVGDIIEQKYRLHRATRLHLERFTSRLSSLREEGTIVTRLSGNHDEHCSDSDEEMFGVVQSHAYHSSLDGRRWLVIHGDLFDLHHQPNYNWRRRLGSWIYPYLLQVASLTHKLRSTSPSGTRHRCTTWKLSSSRARSHIKRFESFMVRIAGHHQCDGVICGHIHLPTVKTIRQKTYANCGDWVEHRSCIIETEQGDMQTLQNSISP